MRKIVLLTTISLVFFACQTKSKLSNTVAPAPGDPSVTVDTEYLSGDTSLVIIFTEDVPLVYSQGFPPEIKYDTVYHRWYSKIPPSKRHRYQYEQDLWADIKKGEPTHEVDFLDSLPPSTNSAAHVYFLAKVVHMNEDHDMY